MRVLFYGPLADMLGSEIDLSIELPCTVAVLRQRLAETEPTAADVLASKRARACVGESIVPETHLIAPDDEVEFFPPVSGG